jgi:hypothetical protein
MKRGFALLAVVLAGAVLAAGCGGSSNKSSSGSSSNTVSTDEWAGNLCDAFVSWTTTVRSAGDSLKSNVTKDSVKSAAGKMKDATSKLKNDLKGLGKPDTDAGDKAKQTIDTLAGQLQTDADKIETAIGNVSGGKGVIPAVSTISTTLQNVGTQVRTAFTNLQNVDAKGELEKAFNKSDSCKKLTNASG